MQNDGKVIWIKLGTIATIIAAIAAIITAVVGENGPEFVNFRGGEKVLRNGQTPRGGGDTYNITVEFKGQPLHTKAEIGNAVIDAAAYARRHGNNGKL